MKIWIIILLVFPITIYGQQENKILVENMKNIADIPYIGTYEEGTGCGDIIFWEVVKKGQKIIPLLIEKLNDTTEIKVFVPNFGGKYTVADASYIAMTEIIVGIPTFELLGVDFDKDGCGYCSYWFHLRKKPENRVKFQKAVDTWYKKNMKRLLWIKSNQIMSGDCSGKHPNGGHYELKQDQIRKL